MGDVQAKAERAEQNKEMSLAAQIFLSRQSRCGRAKRSTD
jgi:hypothetical protein